MSDATAHQPTVLVYGSYGYSGDLIARHALERGIRPILAGRREQPLAAQARELGLDHRAFSLDDTRAARDALGDVDVVMHCAGPFSRTSQAMVEHCIATRTHYLDIAGEALVLEALAGHDDDARAADIMLMGGVGFDVVPTDCLAAHLHRRLPTATSLQLGFQMVDIGMPTRGTLHSAVEGSMEGGMVRRAGELTPVPTAWKRRTIDFGDGPRVAVTIPWGDVATAYHSTGIPNIEVYMGTTRLGLLGQRVARPASHLLRIGLVHRLVTGLIDRQPAGPDAETLRTSRCLVWGTATDDAGASVTSRLRCPGPYGLTALTAVEVIQRTLDARVQPGFMTPSSMYGPDFILDIPGVVRVDDDASSAPQ